MTHLSSTCHAIWDVIHDRSTNNEGWVTHWTSTPAVRLKGASAFQKANCLNECII